MKDIGTDANSSASEAVPFNKAYEAVVDAEDQMLREMAVFFRSLVMSKEGKMIFRIYNFLY